MNQVDNLLANPFRSLLYEDKLDRIDKHIGALWPLDINITQQVGNRKFNNEWFGMSQWLTASVEWVCGPSMGLNVSLFQA